MDINTAHSESLIDILQRNPVVMGVSGALPTEVRPDQTTVMLVPSYAAMDQSHDEWIAAGCPVVFEPVTFFWDSALDVTMVVFECATHGMSLTATYSGSHLDAEGNLKTSDVISVCTTVGSNSGAVHEFMLTHSGKSAASYWASVDPYHTGETEEPGSDNDGWVWASKIEGRPMRPLNFETL